MTKRMTAWGAIKRDFKERFAKFETIRGIILAPVGIALVYATWFHFQYALQVFLTGIGIYWAVDGARKIFVNRVQVELKRQQEIKAAAAANAVK